MAPAGAIVNHSGAVATTAWPTMRARGRASNSRATSAAASTRAAAPSLIEDAFAAVTVPPSSKTGRSAASLPGSYRRGSSSSATTRAAPPSPGA